MSAEKVLLVSVPITTSDRITMRNLRDFVEATSDAHEDDAALVLVEAGELRWEGVR